MIRFFKTLQPATLILIPILILIFWLRIIFHSNPVTDSNSLPLWNGISDFLLTLPSWVNFILLLALISWSAIYLNLILNRYEVLYKNTFVPAIIFTLLISSTPAIMQLHPVHVINLLLLYVINRSFALYKNEFPVSGLFDSGFLAGIASIIYFPAIIFLPLLLTMLGLLRPFRLKEWLIILIAFFLPCFFACTYMFWNHTMFDFLKSYISHFRNLNLQISIEYKPCLAVLGIFIATLLFLSLLKLRINYRKNVIRTRSYQLIFFIYLAYSLVWLLLAGTVTVIHFAFLLLPISVFCAYYFMSAKRKPWLYEYILWGLVLVILWNHIS
jgi:hypothetical protein